jgi:hypothetical protein
MAVVVPLLYGEVRFWSVGGYPNCDGQARLLPVPGPVCRRAPSGPAELPQASLTDAEVVSDFMEQRDAHPKG